MRDLTAKQEKEKYYEKLTLEYCMTPTWCIERLFTWMEQNRPKCLGKEGKNNG